MKRYSPVTKATLPGVFAADDRGLARRDILDLQVLFLNNSKYFLQKKSGSKLFFGFQV